MIRRSVASLAAPSLLAMGITLLAACGGGSGGVADTVPADADLVVKAVGTIAWDAEAYEATATGGVVKIALVNESSLAHNLYVLDADKKANPVQLDTASKGDIDSADFTLAAGTYSIVCRVPGHGAMTATLTVK
jgi:plastocyanin